MYIHIMEYDSTMRIKEILPFETTCMDLEVIMLGEKSQRKTNAVGYHLCTEPKTNSQKNKEQSGASKGLEGGVRQRIWSDCSKGMNSRYKINDLGDLMYSMATVTNNTVSYACF